MRILIFITLSGLLLCSCRPSGSESVKVGSDISVESLFESYYSFKLRINPIEATKAGEYHYNDQIANYISEDYRLDLIENYKGYLDAINAIDENSLTDAQALSLKVMKWDCEVKLEGLTGEIVTVASPLYDLPHFQLMPLGQTSAFQLYVSQLASGESIHPFNTVEDYEDWLLRIDDYVKWMKTAVENMKIGIEKGYVMPQILIERVIGQLEPFARPDVREHLFYQPVNKLPESLTDEEKEKLTGAFYSIIDEQVIPAYQELVTFLRNSYLPEGRETSGIGALPGGQGTYQYLIKYHTTTDMSPDEIFELGLKEVERISGEMVRVKNMVGFEGDLRSFFDHVRKNPDLIPFSDPQEVIENFNGIHNRMKDRLTELFDLKPKAGFEVRRTEAFREQSASAEYLPGTKDGLRPGVFYVPIRDVRTYNTFADEALFLHEAIPGHHYQLSLQQENQELPEFLHAEGMGVFVEGWALYAESLGRELGLYEDPFQYFGMLSMEMHRAIRLVVDAGIHAKGWTREQAIQYSLENEAESEASIIAEIERYMVMPGQALSYKIGQLKIRELRSRAEKALGTDFDIREFHNQVLGSGSLPLMLLEEKIDNWIDQELASR